MSSSSSSSSLSADPLPRFLKRSPAGVIVVDVHQFVASPYAHPVSGSTARQKWLQPSDDLAALFAAQPTLGAILVFNKTRDTQRVCPICYRLFLVGEGVPGLDPDVVAPDAKLYEEQEASGICSSTCARTAAADGDGADEDEAAREEYPLGTTAAHPSGMRVITPPHELDAMIGGRKMHFVLPGQHIRAETYSGGNAHDGPAVVWADNSS